MTRPLQVVHFLLVSTTLLAAMGMGCALQRGDYVQPAPLVFQQPPTLAEIIQAVNTNSGRVHQLRAEDARLTIPGAISSLRARLDFDRPHRFRLLAETSFTGRELDLGSNDNAYWMWAKRIEPPTVFHGLHDQFFQGAAQEVLPVPPHWLAEALGIVYLDPAGPHEGPYASRDGTLQIRSRLPTPRGELTRILEIDPRRAWVLQQQLYSAGGQRLASAVASQFRYDPVQAVSLPGTVQVDLPPAQLSFTLESDAYVVNQPLLAEEALRRWTLPDLAGHQYVDIGNPSQMHDRPPASAAAEGPLLTQVQPTRQPTDPTTADREHRWSSPSDRLPRAALRRLPAFSAIR